MKYIIFSLLLASCALSQVVDLTPENFDSYVDGSKGAFVEFFAPWCGHCKNLAPAYEQVGDAYSRYKSDVVIAKVDADAHKELGSRFDVHGFPTLKWFPKGSTEPVAYEGGRNAEDLIAFINDKTGLSAKIKTAATAVTVLNEDNFDSIVMNNDKDVLVEFYAPWCGHCKHLAPVWEKLAKAFSNEPNVVIANIDADKFRTVGERYGVTGFPTIKFFPRGDKSGESYEGGRDINDFVSFINGNAGTTRDAEGKLDSNAGKHPIFDAIAEAFHTGDHKSLLTKAEEALKDLTGDALASGKVYLKYMQTIAEKGKDWAKTEIERIEKVLGGAVSPKKYDEFTKKKNILNSFK